MISPGNVVVIVRQARHLIIKAKDGINKAYVTIELLKEKYVSEVEASLIPKWMTECTFSLDHDTFSNAKASIIVCVYHKRNGLYGLETDEFLGQIQLPLSKLHYTDEETRTNWYKLVGRKTANKERGEIQLSIKFTLSDHNATEKTETSKKRSSISKIFSSVKNKLKSPRLERVSSGTYNYPGAYDYEDKASTFLQSPTISYRSVSPSLLHDDVFLEEKVEEKVVRRPKRVTGSGAAMSRSDKAKSWVVSKRIDENVVSGRYRNSICAPERSRSMLDVKIRSESVTNLANLSVNDRNNNAGNYLRNLLKINLLSPSPKKKEVTSTLDNISDEELDNLNRNQLLRLVRDQKSQLKQKDKQLIELQEYIDRLLAKVMVSSPQILEDSANRFKH